MTDNLLVLETEINPYRVPLLKELRSHFNEVSVATCRIRPEVKADLKLSGIRVVELREVSVSRAWKHPAGFVEGRRLSFPLGVRPALKKSDATHVLVGDMGFRTIFALWAAKSSRRKVTVAIWARLSENSERGRENLAPLRARLAKAADVIIVNGRSGANYVHQLGVPTSKVKIIPQVSDHAYVTTRKPPRRPLKLLFVGRLVPLKGVQILLNVLRSFPADALELHVVGDGPDRRTLEEQASLVACQVRFHGLLAGDDLRSAYANADLFVFPSLSDEWGLVVNEALSAGVPVLGSRYAQAVVELVASSGAGTIFDPLIPETLGTELSKFLELDDSGWQALSERALGAVKELTHDAIAAEFASVLLGASND